MAPGGRFDKPWNDMLKAIEEAEGPARAISFIRSHAMAIVILVMWLTDTLVGQFTPALREGIGPAMTFILFACILVPQIFMVWKFMPETAGRSLEEIERSYHPSSS